jgi:hypothetical protein
MVSIFDDDVELSPDYFANARRFFEEHPGIVFFDGDPVVITAAGHMEARRLLKRSHSRSSRFVAGRHVWGCNMNVRRWALDREKFDEALALYGWLSDIEFGCHVAKLGGFGRCEGCRLVHLQVSQGRIPGVKHGFRKS